MEQRPMAGNYLTTNTRKIEQPFLSRYKIHVPVFIRPNPEMHGRVSFLVFGAALPEQFNYPQLCLLLTE